MGRFIHVYAFWLCAGLLFPAGLFSQTEFGVKDDLTVLGADGAALDPDVEVRGFAVFGSTQAAYLGAVVGPGSVVVNGFLSVSSGAYFAGSSTFSAAGSIYVNDGSYGQLLSKGSSGSLQWTANSAPGDNLGNHTATQGLDLAGYPVFRVSSMSITAPTSIAASLWASTSTVTPHLYVSTSGNIGLSTGAPQARLDVLSAGSAAADMAQIWRSGDGVVAGSMSATGVMMAVKFVGDGSALTGVSAGAYSGNINADHVNSGPFQNGDYVFPKNLAVGVQLNAAGYRAAQGAPYSANTSTNGYTFGADGDTGIFSPIMGGGAANGILSFYANNSELVRITAGGVGIGATAPDGTLTVQGSLEERDAGDAFRLYRNLASYNVSLSNSPGTVKISLPAAKVWSNTMLRVVIKGCEYGSGGVWEIVVGGYNAAAGWANTSAEIRGAAPFGTVRLAHDGLANVILLGTLANNLQYPKIRVDEVLAGHSNYTGWGTGWLVSQITNEGGINNIVNPAVSAYALVNGSNATGTWPISISGTSAGAAPSGAAGGALNGTYPDPGIASLPAISGALLTNLTAANISAGTAEISITGNAATATTAASASDSDRLDSLDSLDFVRKTGSVGETITGVKTFTSSVTVTGALGVGALVLSSGALTAVGAGASLAVTGAFMKLESGLAGGLTLAGTPLIEAGILGQTVVLKGASDTKPVRLPAAGNLKLLGGVPFTLAANETISLIYDGANWLELSRSVD